MSATKAKEILFRIFILTFSSLLFATALQAQSEWDNPKTEGKTLSAQQRLNLQQKFQSSYFFSRQEFFGHERHKKIPIRIWPFWEKEDHAGYYSHTIFWPLYQFEQNRALLNEGLPNAKWQILLLWSGKQTPFWRSLNLFPFYYFWKESALSGTQSHDLLQTEQLLLLPFYYQKERFKSAPQELYCDESASSTLQSRSDLQGQNQNAEFLPYRLQDVGGAAFAMDGKNAALSKPARPTPCKSGNESPFGTSQRSRISHYWNVLFLVERERDFTNHSYSTTLLYHLVHWSSHPLGQTHYALPFYYYQRQQLSQDAGQRFLWILPWITYTNSFDQKPNHSWESNHFNLMFLYQFSHRREKDTTTAKKHSLLFHLLSYGFQQSPTSSYWNLMFLPLFYYSQESVKKSPLTEKNHSLFLFPLLYSEYQSFADGKRPVCSPSYFNLLFLLEHEKYCYVNRDSNNEKKEWHYLFRLGYATSNRDSGEYYFLPLFYHEYSRWTTGRSSTATFVFPFYLSNEVSYAGAPDLQAASGKRSEWLGTLFSRISQNGAAESKYFSILPLMHRWVSQGGDHTRNVFFPILWHRSRNSGNDLDLTVFPFFWLYLHPQSKYINIFPLFHLSQHKRALLQDSELVERRASAFFLLWYQYRRSIIRKDSQGRLREDIQSKQTDILYPLISFQDNDDERHVRVFPLYWFTYSKVDQSRLHFIPPFYMEYQDRSERYLSLFPFYGSYELYGRKKMTSLFGPLHFREENYEDRKATVSLFWPFISVTKEFENIAALGQNPLSAPINQKNISFSIFPLVFWRIEKDWHRKIIFPIYWSIGDDNQTASNASQFYGILPPIYWSYQEGNYKLRSFIFPLWIGVRDYRINSEENISNHYLLSGLAAFRNRTRGRENTLRENWFFPIWYYYHKNPPDAATDSQVQERSWNLLLLVDYNSQIATQRSTSHSRLEKNFWIYPLFSHYSQMNKNLHESRWRYHSRERSMLLPVYYWRDVRSILPNSYHEDKIRIFTPVIWWMNTLQETVTWKTVPDLLGTPEKTPREVNALQNDFTVHLWPLFFYRSEQQSDKDCRGAECPLVRRSDLQEYGTLWPFIRRKTFTSYDTNHYSSATWALFPISGWTNEYNYANVLNGKYTREWYILRLVMQGEHLMSEGNADHRMDWLYPFGNLRYKTTGTSREYSFDPLWPLVHYSIRHKWHQEDPEELLKNSNYRLYLLPLVWSEQLHSGEELLESTHWLFPLFYKDFQRERNALTIISLPWQYFANATEKEWFFLGPVMMYEESIDKPGKENVSDLRFLWSVFRYYHKWTPGSRDIYSNHLFLIYNYEREKSEKLDYTYFSLLKFVYIYEREQDKTTNRLFYFIKW